MKLNTLNGFTGILIFCLIYHDGYSIFLFPARTTLQISAGFSWPVAIPKRKLFMNAGYQFNYNMPFTPTEFYKPPFFQRGRYLESTVSTSNNSNLSNQLNIEPLSSINHTKYMTQHKKTDHQRIDRDLSAGELYKYFEKNFEEYGYDSSCVLKAVCQLAKHPLHSLNENNEEDLLAEMLQFLFTPSKHQGFDLTIIGEDDVQQKYELAENIGTNDGNCDEIYSDCHESFLDRFTSLSNSTIFE